MHPASKQQRDPPKRKEKHAASTSKADWESPPESDEEISPVGSSTFKLKPFDAVHYKQAMPFLCPPKKKAKPTGTPSSTTTHTPLAMLNFARIPR
jgi:hypothetical protein